MSLLFAVSNVKGCVFASDRPGAILPFPGGIPGALALGSKDPAAADQWLPFIQSFLDVGLTDRKGQFLDYSLAFCDFIRDRELMTPDIEADVVLQGYGEDEMFPSVARFTLGKGLLPISQTTTFHPHGAQSSYQVVGDGEDILTLIRGVASEDEAWYAEEMRRTARKLKKRMLAKAMETGDADAVRTVKKIRIADVVDRFTARLSTAVTNGALTPFQIAVESFNMDDLIAMAEQLVDVSGTMQHFREGKSGYALTRTIGIVTRAEGFVWIKQG